jgi:anti-sigma B factor antagonist
MSANPIPDSGMPLQLTASSANRRTVVHCNGKLISGTSEYFVDEVKRMSARSDALVLDLAGLTYMDSSGVGALVTVFTSVRRANCEFNLLNVTPRVMRLLQVTNLAKVLRPTSENLL